jgi:alanyl-tRNA synthetase
MLHLNFKILMAFPLDLTELIASENGFNVDIEGV